MNDTFMKTKPVFPLLVSMALPNVISMLVNSLYNIVDSLFVAQINEQAMTALSLVFPIQNFVSAVAIGFGIGINALVALYRGAGDHDRADAAATHGMALSVLHGILCTLAATAIMPGFLARFTADGTIVSMGVTYSTIVFLFATVNMASLAFEKIFQAVGRMKLTMIALISGCVCNILLDPVLIFGLGPVPAMGIAGAALATGIGQAATLVIYLVVYSTTESPVHLRRKALQPDLSLEGRLYAIGVPAILNLALPSLLVTFLNGLLAAFSESYVVVLGIYYKLQTFLYLPANGIVQGMRPLIGYNYGAKEHARVAKLYQLTLGMSAVIMAAGTVICMAASAPSSACSPPTPRPSPSARPPCASSASALWCRRCPPPLPAHWKVWARVRLRWSSPSAGTSSSSCRWRGCSAASSAPPASGTPSGSRKCCRLSSPLRCIGSALLRSNLPTGESLSLWERWLRSSRRGQARFPRESTQ